MPFCKHIREQKLLTADTPFLKAQLYYYEIEEGLWVFTSDLNYRKNLLMTNIYDKSLPMEYHFLNLHYKEKSIVSKSMLVNGLLLSDKTWSVFKAGHATSDYHFKDSEEKNITIYFTTKWFERKIQENGLWNESKLNSFMNSFNTYVLLNDSQAISDLFYESFLKHSKLSNNKEKENKLKEETEQFFNYFINKINTEFFSEDYFNLSDKDRKYIRLAENILLNNLLTEFPGIDKLAVEIGISATKLKSDFKTIHNKSIYQYYSYHQMKMAHQLLSNKSGTVKEIAVLFGYDNPSKFSARFKEQYNITPSSLVTS